MHRGYIPVALTAQLTKNVSEELAGKLGTVVPPPASRLAGVAGQVAGVGVPAGVQDSTVQLDKPALWVSDTVAPAPLAGPALLNVTV